MNPYELQNVILCNYCANVNYFLIRLVSSFEIQIVSITLLSMLKLWSTLCPNG
uniref:Uncharacterized protein n=1 Tax=Anguilla anguilla TaxID=7936 RepID=A0A0E9WLC2_ANGAN